MYNIIFPLYFFKPDEDNVNHKPFVDPIKIILLSLHVRFNEKFSEGYK